MGFAGLRHTEFQRIPYAGNRWTYSESYDVSKVSWPRWKSQGTDLLRNKLFAEFASEAPLTFKRECPCLDSYYVGARALGQ